LKCVYRKSRPGDRVAKFFETKFFETQSLFEIQSENPMWLSGILGHASLDLLQRRCTLDGWLGFDRREMMTRRRVSRCDRHRASVVPALELLSDQQCHDQCEHQKQGLMHMARSDSCWYQILMTHLQPPRCSSDRLFIH
jgi:hypothetical protein